LLGKHSNLNLTGDLNSAGVPALEQIRGCTANRRDSNVIVTFGAPATHAAMREKKSIPLVFASVYDPAAIGCLARNVTGISAKVPMPAEILACSAEHGVVLSLATEFYGTGRSGGKNDSRASPGREALRDSA
jgi:hypothetical protein